MKDKILKFSLSFSLSFLSLSQPPLRQATGVKARWDANNSALSEERLTITAKVEQAGARAPTRLWKLFQPANGHIYQHRCEHLHCTGAGGSGEHACEWIMKLEHTSACAAPPPFDDPCNCSMRTAWHAPLRCVQCATYAVRY